MSEDSFSDKVVDQGTKLTKKEISSKMNFVQLDLKLNPKIGLNHHHPTPNFSQAYRHQMRIRFGKTRY